MKKTTNVKKQNASPPKDTKLPNINQKGKSPTQVKASPNKSKTEVAKGKANLKGNSNTTVLKTVANTDNKENLAKKMEELKEKRKKRLEKEKKEEERDKKVYEEVFKEFQENKARTNTETNISTKLSKTKNKNDLDNSLNSLNNIKLPQIKMSEKKTQAILEESGMLDAYKYLIVQLCKNGFPTGNLFEYSAYVIKNYEKKWKEKKSKMTKEKVEKYWQEKKEQIESFEKNQKKGNDKRNIKEIMQEENKIKALNRSFEEREINKIIKNLDKSRSSLHKQVFPTFNRNKSEEKAQDDKDKKIVSVPQKESKNRGKENPKQKSPSPTNNANKKKTQKPEKTQEKSPNKQKKKTTKK